MQHPVHEIFSRAAADVPGYPAKPLVDNGRCVLLGPGDASNLIASYTESEATLWIDHYMWSEYEWTTDDTDELHLLSEAVAAVQRGDGEIYFRPCDGRLIHVGARIGNTTIVDAEPDPTDLLVLPLVAWEREITHPLPPHRG